MMLKNNTLVYYYAKRMDLTSAQEKNVDSYVYVPDGVKAIKRKSCTPCAIKKYRQYGLGSRMVGK